MRSRKGSKRGRGRAPGEALALGSALEASALGSQPAPLIPEGAALGALPLLVLVLIHHLLHGATTDLSA